MTFRDSHNSLVEQIRERIQNGEFSERSLARQLGVSQSHINNVLRGRRKLSSEIADLILNSFNASILDLYPQGISASDLDRRVSPLPSHEFAVLKRAIGPGQPWLNIQDGYRCLFPFPVSTPRGNAVLARFLRDPRMRATLTNTDIALVDTSIAARSADCPSCLYVVSTGRDAVIRWIRGGANRLYLVDERNYNRPLEWDTMPMDGDQRIEAIKGSIVWLGTEAALRWV